MKKLRLGVVCKKITWLPSGENKLEPKVDSESMCSDSQPLYQGGSSDPQSGLVYLWI